MTMKKMSVGVLVVLMSVGASVSYGQDEGFTLDNEIATKYMWRGFDLFGENSAWFPSTDIDLSESLGEGWGLNLWAALPLGSGSEDLTEVDYTLSFTNTLNEGEMDEMEYSVGYIFYTYPKDNSDADVHELGLGLSWPNALSDSDLALVPSFYVGQYIPETGGDGTYWNLRVDWEVECPDLEKVFSMYSDISYNDGVGGKSVKSDFSHISFGISTDVEVMGVAISPYVNFQKSMDDSVNKNDELWSGFSTSITF